MTGACGCYVALMKAEGASAAWVGVVLSGRVMAEFGTKVVVVVAGIVGVALAQRGTVLMGLKLGEDRVEEKTLVEKLGVGKSPVSGVEEE